MATILEELQDRLDSLAERKLAIDNEETELSEIISKALVGEVDKDAMPSVEALSLQAKNNQMEAIKALRAATGWGLRESKFMIDCIVEFWPPRSYSRRNDNETMGRKQ